MIDRRFISTSLVVNGIINSLPKTPTAGVQYLVQGVSSSDLQNFNNYIVHYNGTAWEYIPPHSDMLEIINSQTGDIMHYDGSSWIIVASTDFITVDEIVDFNYSSSEDDSKFSGIAGVSFISTNGKKDSSYKYYIYLSTGNGTDTISKSFQDNDRVIALNSDGKIYTYKKSNSTWDSGVTPLGTSVIRSKLTGALYKYNGTKWSPIGSEGVILVDNVVNFGYKGSSDDSKVNIKGTKFISYVYSPYSYDNYYISTGNSSPTEIAAVKNSVFAVMEDGVILAYDEYNHWHPYLVPSEGCIIISKADNRIYFKDGTIKKLVPANDSVGVVNEKFTLSSSNITNKSITLPANIISGYEDSVLVFVGGTVHFAGTDFTASGDSISWNGKTLDTVGLKEGDIVVVQYMKA